MAPTPDWGVPGGVTIFYTVLEHQLRPFLACFPPWRNATSWRLSAELCEIFIRLIQNGMLLLNSHSNRVLVRVAVQPTATILNQHGPITSLQPTASYISWPASLTIAHSSGNVSRECPGMNHVVVMLYFSNSFRSLRIPTVPAKRPDINELESYWQSSNARSPLEMSLVESSPP